MHTLNESLETQWTCQQLLLAFMQMMDHGDADGAASLLAPDAQWIRQGQSIQGPAAIRATIAERAPARIVRHHLCNIVVTLHTPDRASSKAYYSAYVHDGPGSVRRIAGPERVGDYHAEFARTPSGWRISILRAQRLFSATGGDRDRSGQ